MTDAERLLMLLKGLGISCTMRNNPDDHFFEKCQQRGAELIIIVDGCTNPSPIIQGRPDCHPVFAFDEEGNYLDYGVVV